jgi:hypothetical protein
MSKTADLFFVFREIFKLNPRLNQILKKIIVFIVLTETLRLEYTLGGLRNVGVGVGRINSHQSKLLSCLV